MDFIHINPHIRVAIHIKKLDDFSLLSRKHYKGYAVSEIQNIK